MPDTPHLPTGATPLMLACGRGNHAVTKAMLKCHADINARDQLGHTALHCAVWGGNLKCVKAVHTQSSYAVHDHFGRTAFHLAASKVIWPLSKMVVNLNCCANTHRVILNCAIIF